MNTASRAPRRCSSRFGMVPGDAVFPSTIISVAINWNANLKLISDAAFFVFLSRFCCLTPYQVVSQQHAPHLLFQQLNLTASQHQGIVQQAAFQVSEPDFDFPS